MIKKICSLSIDIDYISIDVDWLLIKIDKYLLQSIDIESISPLICPLKQEVQQHFRKRNIYCFMKFISSKTGLSKTYLKTEKLSRK